MGRTRQLAGCDPKTVRNHVERRDRGLVVAGPVRRARLIDPFLGKVEEWVDRSQGHVRAVGCTSDWSRSGSTAMSALPGARSRR